MTKKTTPSKKSTTVPESFETALGELETLVQELEKGDTNLADSLARFERGVALAKQCKQTLQDAERKIQILSNENGEQKPADFDAKD